MTKPEITDFRALEPALLTRWSRGQAVTQLCVLLPCAALSSARPVALCALFSFGALVVLARGAYTPSGRFGWANAVTLLRVGVLLTLTVTMAGLGRYRVLAIVCAILGLDLLDGYLARARGDASAFGAHFDMEADAQLVLVLVLRLWLAEGMGAWVLFAGLLRYLYVIWLWLRPGSAREAPRSRFARYAFALLMVGLCGGLVLPEPLSTASALCGTLVVTWSFARSCHFIGLSRLSS